eukprot:s3994_g9.t1
MDAHCQHTHLALIRAILMRGDVLLEQFDPHPYRVLHSVDAQPAVQLASSTTCNLNDSTDVHPTLSTSIISEPVPDDDPLSTVAVSISRTEATIAARTSDDYHGIPSRIEQLAINHQGFAVNLPPNELLNAFVQELRRVPAIAEILHDQLQANTFNVRTWYLHHENYPRWKVPRNIELDEQTESWYPEIAQAWRDMINPLESVLLSIVRPDPTRHYTRTPAVADIIVSQGTELGFFSGLMTVATPSATCHARTFAIAASLPGFVSSRHVTEAIEFGTECQDRHGSVFFGWDQLPDTDQPTHLMHNGHGFLVRIHEHPSVDEEDITLIQTSFSSTTTMAHQDADPLSTSGMAVSISLDEVRETDRTSLMQKRPCIRQMRNEMDAPDWYPPPTQGGGPEHGANDVGDNAVPPEDDHATNSEDDSDQPDQATPSSEEDHDRQSAMMYHLNDPAVHAMIFWTDYERLMREIAWHFHISRVELLDSYELNARPSDIPDGTAPLIIHQLHDIPHGHNMALILLDIEMHANAGETNHQTQPHTRRRALPVPVWLTRNTLLQAANVFEYCRFEQLRCLVEINKKVWSLQDSVPRQVTHGDYVVIRIPPSQRCDAATDAMVLDSQEMTVEDFWEHYFVPSSPSSEVAHSSIGTVSNVSPRLVSSDAIRRDFGPERNTSVEPEEEDEFSQLQEAVSLMQHSATASSSAAQNLSTASTAPSVAVSLADACLVNPRGFDVWPHWYRALTTAFDSDAVVEDEDEGRVAYFDTWYADCRSESTDERSRPARLDVRRDLWAEDLRRIWMDRIHFEAPTFIAWVTPTPTPNPRSRSSGHLILFQFPEAGNIPFLLTLQFLALNTEGISQAVVSTSPTASPVHIVSLAGMERVCRRRCTLHRGAFDARWTDPLRIGENIRLAIPAPGARSHDDILSYPEQVISVMTVPPVSELRGLSMRIEDQTRFIQHLHTVWMRQATAGPASLERLLHVMTWYLDGQYVRYNDAKRPATLGEDFTEWEAQLQAVWADLADTSLDTVFVFVRPTPACSPLEQIHILLIQQPDFEPHVTGTVITTYDTSVNQGRPFSAAAFVPNGVTRTSIIRAARREQVCLDQNTGAHCRTWFNFNLHIHHPFAVDWDGNYEAQAMLQLHHQIIHAPLDEVDNEPTPPQGPSSEMPAPSSTVRIDMQPAIEAFEWLDEHFTLPSFVCPDQMQIPGVSSSWLNLPIWDYSFAAQEIHVYFDGSFLKDTGQAGLAFAVFVLSHGQWYNAGFLSSSLTDADSYIAELRAATVTVKAVYDLLKIHEFMHHTLPVVWIGYDSLTVGKQLFGLWQCHQHPLLGRCARMIVELLEARFSTRCCGWHVCSHQGEPGNEFVDALALAAAQGLATHDVQPFFDKLVNKNFIAAGEWMWMLFSLEFADKWDGHHILLPSSPSTVPRISLIPQVDADSDEPANVHQLHLRIASANVLTLKGQNSTMSGTVSGPTRQAMLLQQMHDDGIRVFALQETRLRRQHQLHDPNYILFSSAATEAGHFGILIGFSTKHAHGCMQHSSGRSHEVFFQHDHFAIIACSPRFLIIRVHTPLLHCIVIAAHAPHTGASEKELSEWWSSLTGAIPAKYSAWQRLLLIDANARVGKFPSKHVGSWQAEEDSPKSDFFLDFLALHDLWLPSTFEGFQCGPGGTWQHTTGKWLRNDFIALPLAWTPTTLQACVNENLDVSTVKEDHAAVTIELTMPVIRPSRVKARCPAKRCEFDLAKLDRWQLEQPFSVAWTTDVHSHADQLQKFLLHAIPHVPRIARPLRSSMTEQTWTLVQQKRFWRNQMWAANQEARRLWLRACFDTWKRPTSQYDAVDLNTLLKQHDQLCATAYGQFRRLARLVVHALRADDVAFFTKLSRQAGELTSPHQARTFWAAIRRSIPKMRARRQGPSPLKMEHLEEQWHPYFQALEVGSTVDPDQLVSECHAYQMQQPMETSICPLNALPSMSQIADAFQDYFI